MGRRSRWAVKVACLAGSLLASTGCLLLTSVSDLGGQTRPTSADGSDDAPGDAVLQDGPPRDGGTAFGPSLAIARTAPGLRGVGVDLTRVYFANESTGEIRSAPKAGDGSGGSTIVVATFKPTDLAVDATRIYWIDKSAANLASSSVFKSSKKDGTDVVPGPNYNVSVRMTLAAGHAFTSTMTASSVWYVMRDGTGLDPGSFGPSATCIVSDGATVFYGRAGVLRSFPEPDGGPPLATTDATDLVVDDTALYWITASGAVQKLDKDKRGGTPTVLAAGVSGLARIALDEKNVYVTAWGLGADTGRVIQIPKAGGPAVDLVKGLHEPWGIVVEATGLFVTNHGDGTVVALPR